VDILEPLPPEEIEHLAASRSFISLGAGETLAFEENRQSLFLLVSGRVQVYEPNPSGQYITISVIDEGTVIGQTGFAALTRPALRARALEASVVFRLGWEDFEDLVRRNPEVGIRLIRLLHVRLSVGERTGFQTSSARRFRPGSRASYSSSASTRASSPATAAASSQPATPTSSSAA
jgi:CRP-like cAMP-binding protein